MVSVGLLLPPRFAVLSFAPLAAFETANMVLGERFYDMHLVSASGGQIMNSLGKHVETERGDDVPLDTLLVGTPLDVGKPSADVLAFLRRA
jgi:transcriptional regulator GlxA family with amidase domain